MSRIRDSKDQRMPNSRETPQSFRNSLLLFCVTCITLVFWLHIDTTTIKHRIDTTDFELDIRRCRGYKLIKLERTDRGLSGELELKRSCKAFGHDVRYLTLNVSYDTVERLHVHIYDKAHKHWQLPEWLWPRPSGLPAQNLSLNADLEFKYINDPFEWFIERRSTHSIIFDTRSKSLPIYKDVIQDLGEAPFVDSLQYPNNTAMPAHPFIFEDSYIQLSAAVLKTANIYGLGQGMSSSGFRRNHLATVQPGWASDHNDLADQNTYGNMPFYVDHRIDNGTSRAHGVFLLSSEPMDIILREGIIQYRLIGGTLDLYFYSGPTPNEVVQQHGQVVGFSALPPLYALGFNLCRWGYRSIDDLKDNVKQMRDANIPLEVQWSDIDYMDRFRNWQTDPDRFPSKRFGQFIDELHENQQHYVMIIDAAIAADEEYEPYLAGHNQDVFLKNPDGSEYIGQVWPGKTVYPDYFAKNTQQWWEDAFLNFSKFIKFDGIWLDMNEPSSFCIGSCMDPPEVAKPHTATQIPFKSLASRAIKTAIDGRKYSYINKPPYQIHNGINENNLAEHTVSPNATHANGALELDVHNLYGFMETRATHLMWTNRLYPHRRPFIISRSTFSMSGMYGGSWLGDNFATWEEMRRSIQGILSSQLFHIALNGADTCGFHSDATEELCNRWMMLGAFSPFFRNHNDQNTISQEPYRWESVAEASRIAIAARYQLLPYWYTRFALAHFKGLPTVQALSFAYPDDSSLLGVSDQYLIGDDLLITPVLAEGANSVDGYLPSYNQTIWRNWFTHDIVQVSTMQTGNCAAKVTFEAPLGTIPVHIRGGSILLLYAEAKYTTAETAASGYALLASLDRLQQASGYAYQDDGISYPVQKDGDHYSFKVSNNTLKIKHLAGGKLQKSALKRITILGVRRKPSLVLLNGAAEKQHVYDPKLERLVVSGLEVSLDQKSELRWI